jgi:electron transport complex protein RnfB
MAEQPEQTSRRSFLTAGTRAAAALAIGGAVGAAMTRSRAASGSGQPAGHDKMVWQINPYKCTQCGKCATNCVLNPSAVKCYHVYPICGYCKICTGFFKAQPNALNTGAENQICPTAAIQRTWIEDQYYEYKIIKELCIGCAKCVKGCTTFANGSLFLQIDRKLCVDCNQCSIAMVCPPQAISRIPVSREDGYLLKTKTRTM